MTVYGSILPGATSLVNWWHRVGHLTQEEKHRLKVVDWYRAHGQNAGLTGRHFGHHRQTIARWVKRFRLKGLVGLRTVSRRPHHFRQPAVRLALRAKVLQVRDAHPRWSKYKIGWYLEKPSQISSIGRVLKQAGRIPAKVSRCRAKAARSPKRRFPRGLVINKAGQLIQLDTKHLVGLGGAKLYQFTAIDVLSKVRVLGASTRCSSRAGAQFLTECLGEFPFQVQAVQTDNGSEWQRDFRQACQRLGLTHYFTDAYSPKQNSYVERSHRTDDEEFYGQGQLRSTLGELLPLLKRWQAVYNQERPHQSLNYLTPLAYWQKYQKTNVPTKDYVCLQT